MSTQSAYVARGPMCWGYSETRPDAVKECARHAPSPRSIKGPIVFDVFEVDAESDVGICNVRGSISVTGGSGRLDLVGAHLHDANGAEAEPCPSCGKPAFDTGEIFLGCLETGGTRVCTAYTCGCTVETLKRKTGSDAS